MDFEKKILELEKQIAVLKRSYYRDMRDKWQFSKDIGHPVNGTLHPLEAEQIFFEQVACKCRGK